MVSLAGVYIKHQIDDFSHHGESYNAFMLIFPHKRRCYYLRSQVEKDKWVTAIQNAVGY